MLRKLIFEFGFFNIYRLIRDFFAAFFRYGIIGATIRVEVSSQCQLRCARCPNVDGTIERAIGKGHIKFRDFKKIVDSNLEIRNIELSNFGEIFLNPELKQIIEYAYIKRVNLTALNGVNLNTASEEVLEALVKFDFRVIYVSIDGASNETYKIYRKGGDFNRVIQNVERINYYKHKYKKTFPLLVWQFILFGHNEHELSQARKKAKELQMGFTARLNYDPAYSPIKDKESVRREVGFISSAEYKAKFKREYSAVCYQLWDSPQINWDGRVFGCCMNFRDDFGNILDSGLEKCLKSERYIYAKNMILGRKRPRKDIPCFHCGYYKGIEGAKIHPLKALTRRFLVLIKTL